MAMKLAIIRTEVLYDDAISPTPSSLSLKDIAAEGEDGAYSVHRRSETILALTRAEFLRACEEQGTDPTFFSCSDDEPDTVPTPDTTEDRHFLITWTIDVWAPTALLAAHNALTIHRDPSSIATTFQVQDVETQDTQIIDLTPGV